MKNIWQAFIDKNNIGVVGVAILFLACIR